MKPDLEKKDLEKHLEKIESELVLIRRGITDFSSYFVRGMLQGAGYLIGAAIILTIVGWILNIAGVIPAFSDAVDEFRSSLNQVGATVPK